MTSKLAAISDLNREARPVSLEQFFGDFCATQIPAPLDGRPTDAFVALFNGCNWRTLDHGSSEHLPIRASFADAISEVRADVYGVESTSVTFTPIDLPKKAETLKPYSAAAFLASLDTMRDEEFESVFGDQTNIIRLLPEKMRGFFQEAKRKAIIASLKDSQQRTDCYDPKQDSAFLRSGDFLHQSVQEMKDFDPSPVQRSVFPGLDFVASEKIRKKLSLLTRRDKFFLRPTGTFGFFTNHHYTRRVLRILHGAVLPVINTRSELLELCSQVAVDGKSYLQKILYLCDFLRTEGDWLCSTFASYGLKIPKGAMYVMFFIDLLGPDAFYSSSATLRDVIIHSACSKFERGAFTVSQIVSRYHKGKYRSFIGRIDDHLSGHEFVASLSAASGLFGYHFVESHIRKKDFFNALKIYWQYENILKM